MTARRSEAPPFKVGDLEFVCWITSDGQRYVWRAEGDRLLVGRYEGAHTYWAKVDGILLPSTYKSLRHAMMAAYRSLRMSQVRRAG
jgi:hypothetical protein